MSRLMIQNGARRWSIAAVCVLAAGSMAVSDSSEPPIEAPGTPHQLIALADFEVIDLVITPAVFTQALNELGVDEEQTRLDALVLYGEYVLTVNRLESEVLRDLDRAGRGELENLWDELAPTRCAHRERLTAPQLRELIRRETALRDDPRWAQVNEMQRQQIELRQRSLRQSDLALDTLVASLGELTGCSEEQLAAFSRWLRRQLLDDGGFGGSQDFDARVDIIALVSDAQAPGNELEPLCDDTEAEQELRQVILAYEIAWDDYLRHKQSRRFRRASENAARSVQPGDPEWRERKRSFVKDWDRRHRVAAEAADAIGALIATYVDDRSATVWRHRFLTAICPDLMESRWLDSVDPAQFAASEDERQAIAELVADYRERVGVLRESAYRTGVEVRRAQVMAVGSSPVQQRHARALIAIHRLARRTVESLAPFTHDRPDLVPGVLATRQAHRELGPRIDGESLRAIGAFELYFQPLVLSHSSRPIPKEQLNANLE